MPYAGTSSASEPSAATHRSSERPTMVGTNRWWTAPIASAATAARSAPPDRVWFRSTSCRATTSASSDATEAASTARSTYPSATEAPWRMLNVATRMA